MTLIFSLDRYARGDGRVPGRPRAGQGQRPRPDQDRLGGVVLRVPGGHRDRQAAGEDRHRRRRRRCAGKAAIANAQLAYEAYERGVLQRPLAGARRRRRAPAASAVGVDLDQEPRLPRRHLRRGADRPRRGQHDAGGGHPRVRRPRRDPPATRSPASYDAGAAGARRPGGGSASTSTTWSTTLEREGVEKFEASCAASCSTERARPQLGAQPTRRARGRCSDGRAWRPRPGSPVRGAGAVPRRGRRRRGARWSTASVPGRLAAKDPTLWGPDAEEEAKIRLGWVDTFRRSRELLPQLAELRDELADLDHVVLAGMGGSSLAPEVITRTLGMPLTVLDTTDPRQVRAALDDRLRTHGRGGGQQVRLHGGDRQPPPGLLAGVPRRRADRGRGRPALRHRHRPRLAAGDDRPRDGRARGPRRPRRRRALLGADRVRPGARRRWPVSTWPSCSTRPRSWPPSLGDDADNPALALGAALGAAATAGRDKVALVADGTGIVGLGDWAEQLHRRVDRQGAASGILPVVVEAPTSPGADRRRRADASRCGGALAAGRGAGRRRPARRVRQRPARRAVPGLGVRDRDRRPGARHQPVRPAQRHRVARTNTTRILAAGLPDGGAVVRRRARSRCTAADGHRRCRAALGCADRRDRPTTATSRCWPTSTGSATRAAAELRPLLAAASRAAGHLRLGAALPALHRPVPQGRPAGRRVPPDHRRGRPTTCRCPASRTRFGELQAAQAAGDRQALADRGPPGAAPAPDRPRGRRRAAARRPLDALA